MLLFFVRIIKTEDELFLSWQVSQLFTPPTYVRFLDLEPVLLHFPLIVFHLLFVTPDTRFYGCKYCHSTDVNASKYDSYVTHYQKIVEFIFLNTSRICAESRTQTGQTCYITKEPYQTQFAPPLLDSLDSVCTSIILITSMNALIHCIEKFMCFALYKVPKIQLVYRLPSPTTFTLIGNIIMLPSNFLIYTRLDIYTRKL